MRVARALTFAMVLTSGPGLIWGQPLSPRTIAARARPAVLYVEALSGGEVFKTGSGFFVAADGTFVTNLHVIQGATAVRVRLNTGEVFDNLYVKTTDARRDLAILRVPTTRASFLPLGDDRPLSVGDPIWVMGNPLGLEGTFSDGLVSARRIEDGVQYIQISAPISPGSSGGPVLNSRAEVVGIATLAARSGQNLNMAVPARYAAGLLAAPDRPRPFAEFAAATRPDPAVARPSAASTETDEAPPWEAATLDLLRDVIGAYKLQGWQQSHEYATGYLEARESTTFPLELDPGDVTIVGMCDGDCTDLDLELRNSAGRTIATDCEDDSVPILSTAVRITSRHKIVVSMVRCTHEPCFFAVAVLKR